MPTPQPHPDAEPAPAPSEAGNDGLVRALPDVLANKIAAGEVVQRPANAVKELVENSLDAGASTVEVVLRRAGSDLIQVVDDGGGMGPRDALACFDRHATSKLRAFEDLERLRTLGFRGEALASIAAVSQVELRTRRRQDAAGTCVRVDGGRLAEHGPAATPDGTSIAVRTLFYNVPARRAFLRSPATEFKHLVETFQALALSHPSVGFRLVHDDTEVYRLPATPGPRARALHARVGQLFGAEVQSGLVPVAEATSYLSLQGVVGAPGAARSRRGDGYLFVNGRFVKNRALDAAVAGAYGALLPEGRHPFFALFLSVDPRHVDVNVHPAKTEVKFDDERGLFSFVRAVVKKGLAEAGLALAVGADGGVAAHAFSVSMPQQVPEASRPPEEGHAPAQASGDPFARPPAPPGVTGGFARGFGGEGSWGVDPLPGEAPPSSDFPAEGSEAFPPSDRGFVPGGPFPAGGSRGHAVGQPPSPGGPRPASPASVETSGLGEASQPLSEASGGGPLPARADAPSPDELASAGPDRAIWQLHGRYLLSPIRSGLLVVDQQAAHERVLYERALAALEGGMGFSQQLLFARTVALAPADVALLEELLPDLRAIGFELDLAGPSAVVVRGVPADVRVGEEGRVLTDLLSQFQRNAGQLQLSARDNLARSLARRGAIKEGQALQPSEARSLIDQLFACREPFTDPAGRPTTIRLSRDELERRFGGR